MKKAIKRKAVKREAIKKETKPIKVSDKELERQWQAFKKELISKGISVTFKPLKYWTEDDHITSQKRYFSLSDPPTQEELKKYPIME